MPFRATDVARWPAAIALGAVLACALPALSGCSANKQRVPARTEYRLVPYVASWEKQPPIAVEKLTAINFAFAHIGNDGRAVLDQAGAADELANLHGLRMRNPRLKILVS